MNQKSFLDKVDVSLPSKEKKKIKITFYGDSPTCATGFGQVSRNILPALHASGKYEIDILGVNYWGDPHGYEGMFKIWPMAINGTKDPYGRARMLQHLMDPKYEFDILFFLQDTFIVDQIPQVGNLSGMLNALRKSGKNFQTVFYYPVDGIPKLSWIEAVAAVDLPVTYSQFGFNQSVNLVPDIKERLQIMPHGVNPKVFFPAPPEEVANFRKNFFGNLADKFIITNVNRNQQRKAIPDTIKAFIEFRKQRPDSVLYLHMAPTDQGWNLPEVIKAFGLDMHKDVILPKNFTPAVGFPLNILNMIYNASDCIVSTTVGEGWGLAWTEAMATKTPVVYPNNTCLGEYITEETGYPYTSGQDADHTAILPHDNEVPRPTAHIADMVSKMIELHDNKEEAARRAENAYRLVSENLFWDKHINPRWVNLLDNLVASQNKGQTVSDNPRPVIKGDVL